MYIKLILGILVAISYELCWLSAYKQLALTHSLESVFIESFSTTHTYQFGKKAGCRLFLFVCWLCFILFHINSIVREANIISMFIYHTLPIKVLITLSTERKKERKKTFEHVRDISQYRLF